MSLTKAEWKQVWESIKRIEENALVVRNFNLIRAKNILDEVKYLKSKVEQVIGQME